MALRVAYVEEGACHVVVVVYPAKPAWATYPAIGF